MVLLLLSFLVFSYALVDYDKQAAKTLDPDPGHPVYNYTAINIKKSSYTMKGHLWVIENPVPNFHIYPPASKACACREKTSDSSKAFGCELATNGGFFIMTSEHLKDYCIGDIVTDGKVIHYSDKPPVENRKHGADYSLASDPNSHTEVDFGLTKDGNYIIGFLGKHEVDSLNLAQLIGGVIWLVRKGDIYVNQSRDVESEGQGFIDLAAPRTSIGFDKEGRMLICVFEGYESKKQGPNLYELAQILLNYGAYNMINLDGGGSSTFIQKGDRIWPTGTERAVTTMLCVKPSK